MITPAKFFGGQQDVTWSGLHVLRPWTTFVVAKATSSSSALGLPVKGGSDWFHHRAGVPYFLIWNAGVRSFLVSDGETPTEGISETLDVDEAMIVGLTQVPDALRKWVVMRLESVGGS